MFAVLSALVASACVLASARRLAWAVAPTGLDPRLLVEALGGGRSARLAERAAGAGGPQGADWALFQAAIAGCPDALWERDVLSALETRDEPARVALLNEQLRELDWRVQRWSRAPRVCVRVAASAGFLFACVALVRGLTLSTEDAGAALTPALDAFAIGVAGASFCFAVHRRVRAIVRERRAAIDRLVERLESLATSRFDAAPSAEPSG